MKVRELIERLEEMDPELEAWAWEGGEYGGWYYLTNTDISVRNGRVEIG